MKKKIFFFSFFLTFTTCVAQSFFFGNYEIKLKSEELLQKYSKVKDSTILNKFEKKELSKTNGYVDKCTVEVIFNVLKAQNQTIYIDSVNERSTKLYQKAINISEKANIESLQIWANTRYAYYLYNYRKMHVALPVFLKSINLIDSNSESFYIEAFETNKKIGYFLLTLGQNKEALRFLMGAEKSAGKESKNLGELWDNIAVNYIKTKNYKAARAYLEKAKKSSLQHKDYLRYAKILGNTAFINDKEGNHPLAITQLLEDISISEKYKNDKNTMYALIMLSNVYMGLNDINNAEQAAKKAHKYALSKPYYKSSEFEIVQILIKTAQKQNRENDELKLRRKLDEINIIISNTDSNEAVTEANWIAQKELVENKLNTIKAKSEKDNLMKTISYILIILLLLILTLLHFLSKRKSKLKDQEHQNKLLKLKIENLKAEQKLDESLKTIFAFNTFINEKTNKIKLLEDELQKIENYKIAHSSQNRSEVNQLLKTHLMTNENWSNFKQAFIQEEPEYYNYIKENFEDLTDSNLRLVILMKLKLDNKEIAQVLGITLDGVKKAKQRLRKKLVEKYDLLVNTDELN